MNQLMQCIIGKKYCDTHDRRGNCRYDKCLSNLLTVSCVPFERASVQSTHKECKKRIGDDHGIDTKVQSIHADKQNDNMQY